MAKKQVIVLVVGWCPPTIVDQVESHLALARSYAKVLEQFPNHEIVVVSGLTDVGVMSSAYSIAHHAGWKLVGVACKKAKDYPKFSNLDEEYIVGENWGDESLFFVNYAIDSGNPFGIINVAGGDQAQRELELIQQSGGFVIDEPLKRE